MRVRVPTMPRTGSGPVDLALDQLKASIASLAAYDFLDGTMVTVVATGGAAQDVNHGLGRAARGVFPISIEMAAGSTGTKIPVYRTSGTNDSNRISVYFDGAGTYKLWVW